MSYDRFSFHTSQILTTADLVIPDATFHFRFCQDGWAACSILTVRTKITNTATVRLLQEISPSHDFIGAIEELFSVPLGSASGERLVKSFNEFFSNTKQGEAWRLLIAFEPLGFVIYGRWPFEGSELLVQDTRDSIVNTVFNLPEPYISEWLNTVDRLAVILSTPQP